MQKQQLRSKISLMTNGLKQFKNSPLFLLYITIFINNIGFGIIHPLLPFYAKTFNASGTTIGILAASYAVAQFIFATFWGQLSDSFGRKVIITISLLGYSLAYLIFGLANTLSLLFVARFLQGLFAAAALPIAQAYVADTTTDKERTKAMSYLFAALGAGMIFGPGLGGFLSTISPSLPFFGAAVISFLNFIFVWLKLPAIAPKKPEGFSVLESLATNFKQVGMGLRSKLLPYFIMIGLWSYGVSNNQAALPLLGMIKLNLSASDISWIFSITGFFFALMQILIVNRVSRKLGEQRTTSFGLFSMAIALFLMSFSPSYLFLILTAIILTFGSALARPNISSIISKLAVAGQGTTMGIALSFEALGRILGPATGGYLFEKFYGYGPFWASAFSILLFLIFYHRKNIFNRCLTLKVKHPGDGE
ncbi:MAG: MFS transporter [Candidatus Nealsonbacteria bacterium]